MAVRETDTVRMRHLKQKIVEVVREAGNQQLYSHGIHPVIWKQIGYRLPEDLVEKLHTPEPYKRERE